MYNSFSFLDGKNSKWHRGHELAKTWCRTFVSHVFYNQRKIGSGLLGVWPPWLFLCDMWVMDWGRKLCEPKWLFTQCNLFLQWLSKNLRLQCFSGDISRLLFMQPKFLWKWFDLLWQGWHFGWMIVLWWIHLWLHGICHKKYPPS